MKKLRWSARYEERAMGDEVASGRRLSFAKKVEKKISNGELPYGNRCAIKQAVKARSNIRACRARRSEVAAKVDQMIAERPLKRPGQ